MKTDLKIWFTTLVEFTYLFPLPVWQQVNFDVGVGGAADVHGSQVLALDDRHVQDTASKIVLNLETK